MGRVGCHCQVQSQGRPHCGGWGCIKVGLHSRNRLTNTWPDVRSPVEREMGRCEDEDLGAERKREMAPCGCVIMMATLAGGEHDMT